MRHDYRLIGIYHQSLCLVFSLCAMSISSANAYNIPTVPSGAVCNGTADDTVAFVNALTVANINGGVLEIPLGTCVVNSPLVLNGPGTVSIVGQGQNVSTLITTSPTISQIVVNENNVVLKDFQLTRTVTAMVGANGVSMYNPSGQPNNGYVGLYIDDVQVLNAYTGFDLWQGTGYITNSLAENCQNVGFRLTVSSNATQNPIYSLFDDSALFNASYGFYVNIPATPGVQLGLVGRMRNLYSSGNTGGGLWVVANPISQMQDFWILDSVFEGDGNDELHLDTGNGSDLLHSKSVQNVVTGSAGSQNTGPGGATPPSHIGYGIYLSSATAGVDITGGADTANSLSGLYILSPNPVTVTGRREFDNGLAGTTYSGIDIESISGYVNINGGFSGNDSSGIYKQKYGIYTTGGAFVAATGIVCQLNTSAGHFGTITVTPTGSC